MKQYVAYAINGDEVKQIGEETNKAELIRFCKSFVDSGWVVVVSRVQRGNRPVEVARFTVR